MQRCHSAVTAALGTPCTALPRARAQGRAPGHRGAQGTLLLPTTDPGCDSPR